MSELVIREINILEKELLEASKRIRKEVFVVGQEIHEAIENDDNDDVSLHYIALYDNQPAATLRVRDLNHNIAKIERMAVLEKYRNKNIGKKLMDFTMEDLQKKGFLITKLHAQMPVRGFYSNLGFIIKGEIFYEAGLAHIAMEKKLTNVMAEA